MQPDGRYDGFELDNPVLTQQGSAIGLKPDRKQEFGQAYGRPVIDDVGVSEDSFSHLYHTVRLADHA